MNCLNLKNVESVIKQEHPLNIINNVKNINIMLFKVKIEYKTYRNNIRNRYLYFFINTINPNYSIDKDVDEWLNNYNKNKEDNRKISNAIILEKDCLGFISL